MESALEVRRKEDGMELPVTWRYTPRRSWAEMEARFASEDVREDAQTLIDRWGP